MKDRTMSRLAATNARKLQRLADASDGDVAAAAGWQREAYNRMINRALNGEGDLTLDQARTIAERVYGLPLHVILIEDPKEFMQWLADHTDGAVVIDLRSSKTADDMDGQPSGWTAREILDDLDPAFPLRAIDYLSVTKSHDAQGLVLTCR